MTSELQWRRRWKPNLNACPWMPLRAEVEDDVEQPRRFFVKTKFDDNYYEILISDLTKFWYEKLGDGPVQKRISNLNPSIEAPLTKVLDQIQNCIQNPGMDTRLSLKQNDENIVLEINSQLVGMPFCYSFQASQASHDMGRDHLIIPLMAMVGELYRQQKQLFNTLAAKDKQIEDYKAQGAQVSRKYLEITPFDEVAFRNNMVMSKGFEDEVKTYGEKAFTSIGQDLYKDIVTKRAWLQSTPVKDVILAEPTETMSGTQGDPSVESWSNRIPASLAQNTSPGKTAASNLDKSPASSKGSSAENTPSKDSELLRRQALERKLELEEAKQQEKMKKKKKLKL